MQERPHKYEGDLREDQRFLLHQLLSHGKGPVRQPAHARILWKIDRHAPGPRLTDEQVAWWNWATESTSAMKQCEKRSKKRAQAVAKTVLVHSC
ncbi:MAG TPA: hypothetical protein VKB35_17600 [Ktedonobacteraceae bacterium]|nr:hypothetical protein [Ktedonobacteraceae bacterium]